MDYDVKGMKICKIGYETVLEREDNPDVHITIYNVYEESQKIGFLLKEVISDSEKWHYFDLAKPETYRWTQYDECYTLMRAENARKEH